MPVIEDNAEYQVVETITANGKTVQFIPKPGSTWANRESLETKAQTALAGNQTYLGLAALPAGSSLTTTQLTTAVRALRSQVDALTRQNNALIRMVLNRLDDTTGT